MGEPVARWAGSTERAAGSALVNEKTVSEENPEREIEDMLMSEWRERFSRKWNQKR
jgi:hypothetical protein